MNTKTVRFTKIFLLLGTAAYASSWLQISYVWGTQSFSFAGINMLLPLFGLFLGSQSSLLFFALYASLKFFVGRPLLTFGIPTLFASLTWSSHINKTLSLKNAAILKVVTQLIIPFSCMGLFLVHPVGGNAALYATYWLIPPALFIYHYIYGSNTFSIALSSTFVAHALGSTIVLYLFALPATKWLSLIPLVAVERFVFAAGSTLVYHVAKTILSRHAVLLTKLSKKLLGRNLQQPSGL